MRSIAFALCLAACAPQDGAPSVNAAADEPRAYPTILDAEPMEQEAPVPRGEGENELTIYAKMYGLSNAEAAKRVAEQEQLRPEFERLNTTLRQREAGNYLGAKLIHLPDWHYELYFKRDPEGRLTRYTRNPRFVAKQGGLSEAERQALMEPWNKRWQAAGIPHGFGIDAVYPTIDVSLSLTRDEYAALAKANGWPEVPSPIVLEFDAPLAHPAVSDEAAPMLRGFSHERFGTGMQLEALGSGKLILRDGCLKFVDHSGEEKLAVFHRETGVALDMQGRLVLIDRATGKVKARVGEDISFAAPNAIPEGHMVGLAALQAQCPGEPYNVGNPESSAVFNSRYGG